MVKVGDHFDSFIVTSVKVASALDDYMTLAGWFKESFDSEHQSVCNQLYNWFCRADDKGTLAFGAISQQKG